MAMSKQNVRLFMGCVTAIGFFGLLAALIVFKVPVENADILKVLVGFLGGSFVTVIAFYFGDSEGK